MNIVKIENKDELKSYLGLKVVLLNYPERKILPLYVDQVCKVVLSKQFNKTIFHFKQFEEKGKALKERNAVPFDKFSPSYPIIIEIYEEQTESPLRGSTSTEEE